MYYKYRGEKQQVSTDNGRTWTDTGEVRPRGDVVEVYNYECACEGTCYEITPNVIISSGDDGGIGSLTDRGDGCMTWTTGVYPDMNRTFIITIKDLNEFDFLFRFGCGTEAGSFRMEVYRLDDVEMFFPPLTWSNVTSNSRVAFHNIGGGTHQIAVHIYQSGGGWDASCAIIDFDCEYPPAIFRWVEVEGETICCTPTTKCVKWKYQASEDSGETWTDVGDERGGEVVETGVNDCERPYYERQYLTFDIVSGGMITWHCNSNNTGITRTIFYSINEGDWKKASSANGGTGFSVNAGDQVRFKGLTTGYGRNGTYYNTFSGSTASFNIEGNLMSLLKLDEFEGRGLSEAGTNYYTFDKLFANTNVISAEKLILPSDLTEYCYRFMFSDCTSLTVAPELPATTMRRECYNSMFKGCTSLTTAPELPATQLVNSCYYSMFSGCTSLNYIKCLALNVEYNHYQCTTFWVDGVASTGTFVKNANMTRWTTGASGIPTNWTVQNA